MGRRKNVSDELRRGYAGSAYIPVFLQFQFFDGTTYRAFFFSQNGTMLCLIKQYRVFFEVAHRKGS
jgi:hypothetical protein